MVDRPSDEDVGRQILGIFMRYKTPASGTFSAIIFSKCVMAISNAA
jgi:hypothetical protein